MSTERSWGQSAVEFALTLPVFLWLVMGVVDLGRGVASYALVANCAREGARAGIYPQTADADIVAAVNSQSLFMGTIPSADIQITPSSQSARVSGSTITVRVTYRFQPMTPLVANVVGSTLTLTSQSTMLIE